MNIPIKEKISLIDLLHNTFPDASTTKIKKMIQKGCVKYRSATLKHPEFIFQKGDTIEFQKYEARKTYREKSPVPVLFEDEFIIAVLKPQGMAVERSTEKRSSLFSLTHSYLSKKTKGREKPYFVNGIEWDETGICVFAKSELMQKHLNVILPQAQRSYWVLVENRPPFKRGKFLKPVLEPADKNKANTAPKETEEKEKPKAKTLAYEILKEYDGYSLLALENDGYVKYEIRNLLAEHNIPVIGDRRHSSDKRNLEILKIFNFKISFNHPKTGKKILLETSMPATFDAIQMPMRKKSPKQPDDKIETPEN